MFSYPCYLTTDSGRATDTRQTLVIGFRRVERRLLAQYWDNMTDALAAPLGNLVIAFNDLEIAMGGALMHILRNDDEFVGTVFISVLGFSQKYALLKALAVKLDNTKKRDDLLALLETARHLNEERNREPVSDIRVGNGIF